MVRLGEARKCVARVGSRRGAEVMSRELAVALGEYAARFHAAVGSRHHVASPIAAWLLLALASPVTSGEARRQLEKLLGMDVGAAQTTAGDLLASRPPELHLGLAAWTRPGVELDGLQSWMRSLPDSVDRGALPPTHELDAWASRHTAGLIKSLPIAGGHPVELAVALGVRLQWLEPFKVVAASALGSDSVWTNEVRRVLSSQGVSWQWGHIVDGGAAGDLGVHIVQAGWNLRAISVIAPQSVPIGTVMKLAHLVDSLPKRSLFALPPRGPLWTITEEPVMTTSPDLQEEVVDAVLPAWSAGGFFDLLALDVGFGAVAASLSDVHAVQTAVAEYSRTGFKAAALGHLVALGLKPQPRPGRRRTAVIRFSHPYAVVLVAAPSMDAHAGPWNGVPVFSAWVTQPCEA